MASTQPASSSAPTRPLPAWGRALIDETTVMLAIVVNAVVLILAAFPEIDRATLGLLAWVDYGFLLYFMAEAALKIRWLRFRGYWASAWNRLDFFIVVASLPLLAAPFAEDAVEEFGIILLFRLGRFLRFSRLMRFVPNASEIGRGVLRSLRASVAVFVVLFVLNLILAMGANYLFGDLAPEYFGDPLIAFYSLFKVFTVEGWYEIPELLVARGEGLFWAFLVRIYFVASVLIGGLLGLSLANAVFVDEMTADNNREVERMVRELHEELRAFREEMRVR